MHLKRLYKALAIVVTVAMILPQTWVSTYAEGEGEVLAEDVFVEAPADPGSPVEEVIVPPVAEKEAPAPDNQGQEENGNSGEGAGDTSPTPMDPSPSEEPTQEPERPTETPAEPTPEVPETPTPEVPETPTPGVTETPTPKVTEAPKPTSKPTDKPTVVPTQTPEVTQTPEGSTGGGYGSNVALIAAQKIVMPPITVDNYRFTTIEKVYGIAKEALIVYEEQDIESREIGTLEEGGLCFIISDIENSEWIYVESGNVRGFIKAEFLTMGAEAITAVSEAQEENMVLAVATVDPTENKAYTYVRETVQETKAEKVYAIANDNIEIVEDTEADAKVLGELPKDGICFILGIKNGWLYVEADDVRGFVEADQVIVGEEAEKQLAEGSNWTEEQAKELAEQEAQLSQMASDLATDELNKKQAEAMIAAAGADTDEATIRELEDEIASLEGDIAKKEKEVEAQSVVISEAKAEKAGMFGKNIAEAPKVNQLVAPEDNKAFYFTLKSAKDISVSDAIGRAMVEFGSQFLGNPYVWGGTSLTNGADCSGFVQAIYSQFGYSIPRTSGEQSQVGMQIPVSEARTGDLIFYARNGVVYHVVMYIDNGQVLHASSSTTGIITSGIDMEHAVWATRMISDGDQDKVDAVNAKAGVIMYGGGGGGAYTNATAAEQGELLGNFKLTAYCNCSVCCGKWAGGPTASGTAPVEGRTVAMAGVPFGTRLIIGGKIYTVEDRGTPYGHVDIYMNNHDECNVFGVQYADVFAVK